MNERENSMINEAKQMMNEGQQMMNVGQQMMNKGQQVLAALQATEEEMMYHAPMTNIIINKGKIIEVEVTNDELQKAYDQLAADYANRCERIEELKDELEIKDALIENLRAQLRAAEQNQRVIYVEKDEEVENTEEEKHEEPQNTEGGDAMSSLINVSDKYIAYPEIVELINYWTNYVNGITEDKKMLGKIVSKETLRQKAIQKANEEIVNLMSEIDNRLAYNITHDETYAANGITSTYGKITLGGKEYAFKYDATFEKPVVYGCMNMDLINEAKAALDALVHLDRDETTLGQKHANKPVYDFENNIVVWVSDDGVFKGYTDKYAFVWDPAQAQPCGITVINALSNFRRYRKMNASWGNGFVDRANFIMRYCRQMVNRVTNDKEVPEETNEIVVNVTKDKEPQVTNEEVETLWDDFDC